jgi:hypothetical protein
MSAAFHRGDSGQSRQPADDLPAKPAAKPTDEPAVGSQMLDQILELALGGAPQAGFVEPEDVTAMRKVAKKLAGHSFALEPVVVELIQAVLQLQFEKAGIPSATVHAMARQIATTLYDDPSARARLEALWAGLSAK